MRRTTLLLICLAPLLFATCEGSIMVNGTVFDITNDRPVQGAVVHLSIGDVHHRSDTSIADGTFYAGTALIGMVCGEPRLTLHVEATGYKSFSKELDDDERVIVVKLTPE